MATDYPLFLGLAIALYTDIRRGKIYNWLTLTMTIVALAYHLATGGWTGILFSLQGLAVGGVIFFLPFLLGGMGGGDVKLFAAIGAMQGASFVLRAGIYAGLAGGLCAAIVLVRQGTLRATVSSMLQRLFVTVSIGKPGISLTRAERPIHLGATFPYGFPIVLGTVIARWF